MRWHYIDSWRWNEREERWIQESVFFELSEPTRALFEYEAIGGGPQTHPFRTVRCFFHDGRQWRNCEWSGMSA